MKIKTTKSTTYYYCYGYAVFYDIDDKSYSSEYDISEEINKILNHKYKHRRVSYYIHNGHKVYYKDIHDFIYKLYNNIDIIINDSKYGSQLCIYVDL